MEEARFVVSLHRKYEEASGHKIKLHKSELSCSKTVYSTIIDELKELLRVTKFESHVRNFIIPN